MILDSQEHTGLAETRKPRFFYGYVIVVAASITQLIAFGTYTTTGVFLNPIIDEFGWMRATLSGAYTLAYVIMGFAGDRIGNRRAVTICLLVLVAGLIWVQFAQELWMLYLFVALYGFNHGGIITVISPAVAELFGTRAQGSLLGIVVSIGITISALGPLLAGYIFDVTGGYNLAFLIMLALASIGLVLSIILKPIKKGHYEQGRGIEFN